MPPETVHTLDYHVAGEPLRIVTELADLDGETMQAKAQAAAQGPMQHLRCLASEPRGHSEMFGAFRTDPVRPGSQFGALFFDADPTSPFKLACGHGTMALAAAAVQEGWVARIPGWNDLAIDVPAGQVRVSVLWQDGRVGAVRYLHIPSRPRQMQRACQVLGQPVTLDLIDAGAQVAILPAQPLGLDITPAALPRLRAAYAELIATLRAQDGSAPDLMLFHSPLTAKGYRCAAFFGAGNLDRSPCGTASSAMVALLHATGRLSPGANIQAETMIGTRFLLSVAETHADGSVTPQVEALPIRLGQADWQIDPADPLAAGFFLG